MAAPSALDALFAAGGEPTEFSATADGKRDVITDADIARLAQLPSLEKLSFRYQPWTELPGSLAKLPNLRTLELSSIKLKSLAGLARLPRLQSLALARLQILATEYAHLAELPDLATLRLDQPWGLPRADAVSSVIELHLDLGLGVHLAVEDAIDQLAGYPALRRLTLRGRGLAIPPSIAKLDKLLALHILADTTTVPKQLGALTQLQELQLTGLQVVPDEICALRKLVELRLQGTFTKLPTRIGELSALRRLGLPFQHSYTTPGLAKLRLEDFWGHRNTRARVQLVGDAPEEVAADAAVIEVREKVGPALERLAGKPLRELEIREPVASLPAALGKLASLRVLRLRGRALKAFPPALGKLVALELLDVEDITATLPPQVGQLTALTTLHTAAARFPAELARCTCLTTVHWKLARPPTITALKQLAMLPALKELVIDGRVFVDLGLVGTAFANRPLERLVIDAMSTDGDLSRLVNLVELKAQCLALDGIRAHLPKGRWKVTKETKHASYGTLVRPRPRV